MTSSYRIHSQDHSQVFTQWPRRDSNCNLDSKLFGFSPDCYFSPFIVELHWLQSRFLCSILKWNTLQYTCPTSKFQKCQLLMNDHFKRPSKIQKKYREEKRDVCIDFRASFWHHTDKDRQDVSWNLAVIKVNKTRLWGEPEKVMMRRSL